MLSVQYHIWLLDSFQYIGICWNQGKPWSVLQRVALFPKRFCSFCVIPVGSPKTLQCFRSVFGIPWLKLWIREKFEKFWNCLKSSFSTLKSLLTKELDTITTKPKKLCPSPEWTRIQVFYLFQLIFRHSIQNCRVIVSIIHPAPLNFRQISALMIF